MIQHILTIINHNMQITALFSGGHVIDNFCIVDDDYRQFDSLRQTDADFCMTVFAHRCLDVVVDKLADGVTVLHGARPPTCSWPLSFLLRVRSVSHCKSHRMSRGKSLAPCRAIESVSACILDYQEPFSAGPPKTGLSCCALSHPACRASHPFKLQPLVRCAALQRLARQLQPHTARIAPRCDNRAQVLRPCAVVLYLM